MEEKVLLKSERYSVGKWLCGFFVLMIPLCILWCIGAYFTELSEAKQHWPEVCDCWNYYECDIHYYGTPAAKAWDYVQYDFKIVLYVLSGIGLVCLLIYAWLHSYEMTVTDKRVYGRTAFGKRVDLPIDSISAISSIPPKGIVVASSSGRIAFLLIKNRNEIHKQVSSLLVERQNNSQVVQIPTITQESPVSNADELRKYKELFDEGVITQEEFDAKKKQLLGL